MNAPMLTSRRVWILAVALLLILALLPQRWSAYYGPPLGSIVRKALWPLSGPLTSLGTRLRSQPRRRDLAEHGIDLSDELRSKDALILRLQRRIERLQQINAELQGLRRRVGDAFRFRRANVIGHSGDPASRTYHLDLGSTHGVRPGAPVVVRANLLGRIIGAQPGTSVLRPITAGDQKLEVLFAPPRLPADGLPADRRETGLIEVQGSSRLVGKIPRSMPVEPGDYARLSDSGGPEGWPRSVQGMIVGRVDAVEPVPDDPLRKRVTVVPLVDPRRVAEVTIIVPRRPSSDTNGEER